VKIVAPMPPNLANARLHWRTKHSEKKKYWMRLDLLQDLKEIPKPPAVPMQCASISSVMYLGAAMDDGNAMNRHKWVEDWLTTRGYIADDRKKNLKWLSFPEQIVKRGGDYRIEITLTELSQSAAA